MAQSSYFVSVVLLLMDFFKNALCWVGLSAPRRRPNALEFSPYAVFPRKSSSRFLNSYLQSQRRFFTLLQTCIFRTWTPISRRSEVEAWVNRIVSRAVPDNLGKRSSGPHCLLLLHKVPCNQKRSPASAFQ